MRTIEFSGYSWKVAESHNEKHSPGLNFVSSSPENVWVDAQGFLHLKVTCRNTRWCCACVSLDKPLGFGTYSFFVRNRFDLLDPHVVAGLFLYKDDTHEIDIELSRWGKQQGHNLLYCLHGVTPKAYKTVDAKLNGEHTTHSIVWTPGSVSFQSLHGHYEYLPSENVHLANWSFCKPYHTPTTERVHMNVWLLHGKPPLSKQEIELVITQFAFHP